MQRHRCGELQGTTGAGWLAEPGRGEPGVPGGVGSALLQGAVGSPGWDFCGPDHDWERWQGLHCSPQGTCRPSLTPSKDWLRKGA